MRLGEGFSCIYSPEQNRPTAKCFGLQIWFTSTQEVLFVHDFFPLDSQPQMCYGSLCTKHFNGSCVFSKTPWRFFLTSLTHFWVKIFWTFKVKNLCPAESNILNSFDYLLLLPRWEKKKKEKLASHFGALSHCLVCYCVMNHPPLPPLGEENMFSSSLWQEGIVKVK